MMNDDPSNHSSSSSTSASSSVLLLPRQGTDTPDAPLLIVLPPYSTTAESSLSIAVSASSPVAASLWPAGMMDDAAHPPLCAPDHLRRNHEASALDTAIAGTRDAGCSACSELAPLPSQYLVRQQPSSAIRFAPPQEGRMGIRQRVSCSACLDGDALGHSSETCSPPPPCNVAPSLYAEPQTVAAGRSAAIRHHGRKQPAATRSQAGHCDMNAPQIHQGGHALAAHVLDANRDRTRIIQQMLIIQEEAMQRTLLHRLAGHHCQVAHMIFNYYWAATDFMEKKNALPRSDSDNMSVAVLSRIRSEQMGLWGKIHKAATLLLLDQAQGMDIH